VYLGYFPNRAQLAWSLDLFILRLQQNIPSLFKRSSQRVREHLCAAACRNGAGENYFRGQSVGRDLAHTIRAGKKCNAE